VTTSETPLGSSAKSAGRCEDRETDASTHTVAGPSVGAEIEVRGLRHAFGSGPVELTVLRDLDFDVPAGGYATLAGPSGAGKTTLLSLIGGLDRPQAGTLTVGGVNVASLSGDRLAAYRQTTVGFVFQHFGLLDTLTARENVEVALMLAGRPRRDRPKRANALLEAVGLSDRADHRPPHLSGGERQRVAIARAMANDPRLLLADEPTGNLDETAGIHVVELLEEVNRDRGCTVVIVTHNRTLGDRAPIRLRLRDGRISTQ
jgi:putative ABC transport system ATP-binding protein